jgi:hypothetical protein
MARVSSSGAGGAGGSPLANSVYNYNEVTNVSPGVETTIVTYTAVSTANCYLQYVESSGTNVSQFRVYINAAVVDKKYGSWTQYNVEFAYFTGNTTAPGIKLSTGDVVTITGVQSSTTTSNFNAVIQVLEILL